MLSIFCTTVSERHTPICEGNYRNMRNTECSHQRAFNMWQIIYFHVFEVLKKALASHCDTLIQNQGDISSLKENEIKYSSKCWKFWLIGFVTVTGNQKTFQTILSQNLIFS